MGMPGTPGRMPTIRPKSTIETPTTKMSQRLARFQVSSAVRAMASATVQHFGRIDVCVVAPLPPSPGPLVEAPDERWHAYLEDALVAPQVAIQACVREMLATGHAGDIILVAPPDEPGAAGLVRAGTLALARWWEAELRPTGIRVAALEPRHHESADSLHALVAVACVTVTVEAATPGAFAVGPR